MESGVPFLLTIEFDGGPELLRLAARVQIAARKYGFKPVWLLGPRALGQPVVLEPFARWRRAEEAEIGGLLVPDAVPPLVELGPAAEGHRPFLTDYPERIMEEKLVWFAETLEKAFSHRAVTVRASRPAVDDRYYALLAKHGFKVDLSVVPHAKIENSDFTGYSEKAYLTPQGILEIPRTVRRRKNGPFIEELQALPGFVGQLARVLFPTLRCFRLRKGNRRVVRALAQEGIKSGPGHLDLRVSVRDWARGEALLRDLQRILAAVQTSVTGMSAEEFFQRFKNEQLRKGLV